MKIILTTKGLPKVKFHFFFNTVSSLWMAAVLPIHLIHPFPPVDPPAFCFLFLRFPDIVNTNAQSCWATVDEEVLSTWTQTAGNSAFSADIWQTILLNCVVAHDDQGMLDQRKPSWKIDFYSWREVTYGEADKLRCSFYWLHNSGK